MPSPFSSVSFRSQILIPLFTEEQNTLKGMEKVNIWYPAAFTKLQWWFRAPQWQCLAVCSLVEEWHCLFGVCSWVLESHKWGQSHLSGCEARLRGRGGGDLIAPPLSNFCYGNLFLICSIWILGKWTIREVYHNSSLDKQLNKEWKICILSEGTTKNIHIWQWFPQD